MTRLFTALWPPAEAVAALAADLDAAGPLPDGWRPVRRAGWHLTLAFHGEADPGVLARRLEAAAAGAEAPRLRLAGGGTFPGVAWVGVEAAEPDDAAALQALVAHAGGDPARFVAHLSVLRGRQHRARTVLPSTAWAGHEGPWWSPAEVVLTSSVPVRGGSRYVPVHRVPLRRR